MINSFINVQWFSTACTINSQLSPWPAMPYLIWNLPTLQTHLMTPSPILICSVYPLNPRKWKMSSLFAPSLFYVECSFLKSTHSSNLSFNVSSS